MIIHRIHNGTHAVIPFDVANSGLSAAALGVMTFVQCQRGSVSPGDIAKRFKLTSGEIDAVMAELATCDLVEVMEPAA